MYEVVCLALYNIHIAHASSRELRGRKVEGCYKVVNQSPDEGCGQRHTCHIQGANKDRFLVCTRANVVAIPVRTGTQTRADTRDEQRLTPCGSLGHRGIFLGGIM